MTAEDRKVLKELTDNIGKLKDAFIAHKATIDTTLRSYPEVKKQVYDNKLAISNIWTSGKVVTTLLSLALLAVGAIAAIH